MADWVREIKHEREYLCLSEEDSPLEIVLTEHASDCIASEQYPAMYLWDDLVDVWPQGAFSAALLRTDPELATAIEKAAEEEASRFREALRAGTVRYRNLSRYFQALIETGQPMSREVYGSDCLWDVTSYEYVGGLRPGFVISAEAYAYVGGGEAVCIELDTRISPYKGSKPVAELIAQPASDAEVAAATARATAVISAVDSQAPHKGTGALIDPRPWRVAHYTLQGSEVIPDPFGCAVEDGMEHTLLPAPLVEKVPMPKGKAHLVLPLVACFSLRYKQWGYCNVDDIEHSTFDTELFEKDLVLDTPSRDLICAACHLEVKGEMPIEGKGEGAILLLAGPPGCGKTFTAETLAAKLRTPLYKLDMGELDVTNPSNMERHLRTILARAARWGATLLFDEADVFLAPRGEDIMHKAMVTTFLRKLEYYTGIMILTTNLVQLDPAVMQRALVSIQYGALTAEGRAQIWERNLVRFGAGADLAASKGAELGANYPGLNGRDVIKSLVLAARLADLQGKDLIQGLDQVLSTMLGKG